MTDQLEVIGVVGQLGLGGVMLGVTFMILRIAQKWLEEQQRREDQRMQKITEGQERMIGLVMASNSEQLRLITDTAQYLHKAAGDLRLVTDRTIRQLREDK